MPFLPLKLLQNSVNPNISSVSIKSVRTQILPLVVAMATVSMSHADDGTAYNNKAQNPLDVDINLDITEDIISSSNQLVARDNTIASKTQTNINSGNARQKVQSNPSPASSNATSASNVTVTDIVFTSIQRLTPESLYPLLPFTVGSQINDSVIAAAIKALYASGDFSNVQARLDGTTVVFDVIERPTIAQIEMEGNTLLPTQALQDGLANAGLSEGSVFKESTLQTIINELQQQLIMGGYYNSKVEADHVLLNGNRVKLKLRFIEGAPAKVVDINILGNQYFSDDDIKDVFKVKETSWTKILSKSDRYAQEKLAASLEQLKALYKNKGFVKFTVDNAVLNISEDKKRVFIEIAVTEGQQYTFGNVKFLGETVFSADKLQSLVTFNPNEQYSQKKLDATSNALKTYFGNDGFYFAQIRPVPRIDEANKIVNIHYFIDPANPIYVRRINFSGNIKTKDEVLRREMRQLESALASNKKVQLSRTRLMRTGFFKTVDVAVVPVPNQPDQVDINFTVEEQPTGSSTISAGYSQGGGVTFQLDYSQRNVMGTGNRANVSMSRSETRDNYSLGYTNPYFTENGVSQSVNAYYRKTKYDDKNVSNYITDSYGASLSYGYPVNENIRVSAGVNLDNTEIRGGRFMGVSHVDELIKDGAKVTEYTGEDKGKYGFQHDYNTASLLLGWDYNSLDKPVFPTKGMSHSLDVTLGFGDQTYQKAVYKGNLYQPIAKGFIARGYTKLGYGNEMPFYENFYAGGFGSVRGYETSSLGPTSPTFVDSLDGTLNVVPTEVGGNALATVGTELIIPLPFKGDWVSQVRPVVFAEAGQVFDTTDKDKQAFIYKDKNTRLPLILQDNDMRYSVGAAMTWYTPIGPIAISYARPIKAKKGDDTEKVQFQIGNVF